MAGIGSNLAGYFGVYHRTIATRLKKAVGASPRELEALTSELKVRLILRELQPPALFV